jgi:HSP20 family protein
MAIVRWDPYALERSLWNWDNYSITPVATNNVDVYETGNQVVVRVNVPGVEEKKIMLSFEKGILTIQADAEQEEKKEEDDRKYYRKASRSYSYQIDVPDDADWSKEPKASVSRGILSVIFDKTKTAKPKRIPVQSGT